MDLIEIGKFIKNERKAKGLTQIELANKLMISEKTVSKWECGNGFPDTTLMLPLCEELGITANELLSGKRLNESEYKKVADDNLLALKKQIDEKNKFLLNLECVIGFSVTFCLIAFVFIAAFIEMAVWLRALLIVLGFIQFIFGIHFALLIEKDAGYYECAHCHNKYVPDFKSVYFAMHMGRTRYLKCPKCGKKSWNKKVIRDD